MSAGGRYREVIRLWEPRLDGPGPRGSRRAQRYSTYVPDPIAEWDVPLTATLSQIVAEAEDACRALEDEPPALSGMEGLARQLLRAEAVASSRIEGLVMSHRRLARAQAARGHDALADAVIGNIAAMDESITLGSRNAPLAVTDIAQIHEVLFRGTRDERLGGRVRDRQVWIGGEASSPAHAEFVPPPEHEVPRLLDDLCAFIELTDLPPVLQAAVAHVQFESIHPFLDGNGRVGRALIQVVLRRRGVTRAAVPPVSLVLAASADDYVKGLTSFRYSDPGDWIETFARALRNAALHAATFAGRVRALQERWRDQAGRPRRGSAAATLIEHLPGSPVVDLRSAMALTGASDEAARLGLARLERAGVLLQSTAGRRNRVWEGVGLLDLLDGLEREIGPTTRTPRARD